MDPKPMEWAWLLLDADGAQISAEHAMAADQRFGSQSEAETWIGEQWPGLFASGVAAVCLQRSARTVYGPMPLTAPP